MSAAQLFQKKMVRVDIEDTYGEEKVPGNEGLVVTSNLNVRRLEGQTTQRDIDQPVLGNDETIHTSFYSMVRFDVEIACSGTAGDAPGWGKVLLASGFDETVIPGVSVEYTPASDSFDSATLYYFWDGELYKLIGARGKVTYSLNPSDITKFSFEFTGLHEPVGKEPLPAYDGSAFMKPLAVNFQNSTFSIHGYAAPMSAFSFDMGNEVIYDNLVNDEQVFMVDRSPSGSVSFTKPDIDTLNLEQKAIDHETGALSFVHGKNPGHIVEIQMPKVQLLTPDFQERNKVISAQVNFNILPDQGNDEVKIIAR